MLPRTKIWQKWSYLVALLIVGTFCAQLATPSTGVAQDEQPDDLSGVFTVTIAKSDIPQSLADGPALTGIWSVDFGSEGSFTITRLDVGQVARGTYESGDTTVTFNEWNGLIGCTVGKEEGGAVYGWRRSESALTLTPIREACAERITLLSTRPLGSNQACAEAPASMIAPSMNPSDHTALPGTPSAEVPAASGVTAQEGLSDTAEAEMAVDRLLGQANGCWATGDPQSFLALHSDAVIQELVFTAPPDLVVSRLKQTMMSPASFDRIGDVTLSDPDRAWAYVQFTVDEEPRAVRVDFVNQDGNWLFDTYIPSALSSPPSGLNVQAPLS
jgi:hypothetical protein